MNSSYDILQAIRNKPPVIEVAKARTRKATSKDDKLISELLKKLSPGDLAKLLGK